MLSWTVWKEVLIKASWSGLYAGLAFLVASGDFGSDTFVAVLVGALVRGAFAFVSVLRNDVVPFGRKRRSLLDLA